MTDYEILGIDENADPKQIKKDWEKRSLSM